MLVRWSFAAVHLLALGIGLGAVWARGRALRGPLDDAGLKRALAADNWWGVAAVLWLVTGLVRAFGGLEKGTAYYLGEPLFHAKIGLFILILLLEFIPMIGLVRWRIRLRRGEPIDRSSAGLWAGISAAQAALVVLVLGAGAALARGIRF